MSQHKLVVGLTGGIASGKSVVAAEFKAKGIEIIDSDEISRDLVKPGSPLLQQIVDHFGSDFLLEDGQLNRRALRMQIFKKTADRQWLESILHPAIRQEMAARLETVQSPYCIMVIPLLAEKAPHPLVDRILVVDAEKALQQTRLMARDQIGFEKVEDILSTQATRETRLAKADEVIHNHGDLEAVSAQIEKLHKQYLILSRLGKSSLLYEHPLNELVRLCLKIRNLFEQIDSHLKQQPTKWNIRAAVETLINLIQTADRPDLRAKFTTEFLRYLKNKSFLAARGVNVTDLEQDLKFLKTTQGRFTQPLKNDELLNSLNFTLSRPGGAWSFDIPIFHYWLNQDPLEQQANLKQWLEELAPLKGLIGRLLSLVESNGLVYDLMIEEGFYQMPLDPHLPCQLIKMWIPQEAPVIPEISVGKHRLTLRLLEVNYQTRPVQTSQSYPCGLLIYTL